MATFSDSSFVGLVRVPDPVPALHGRRASRPGSGGCPSSPWPPPWPTRCSCCSGPRRWPEPYEGMVSPWAVPAIAGPAGCISAVLVIVVGLCLLASVYELFSAFRRARGETRQQLLWLVAGAVPLGPAVVAAFAVSYAGYDWVAGPILAFCITTLSLGAGLSVARYRLYDVERVVTDSSAYALSTGAVVAAFGLVVLVITRTVPVGPDSPLSTVLATLAAAGVARPAYVWARNRVDRRFNQRRFDAVRMVEDGLAERHPRRGGAAAHRARRPRGDPGVRRRRRLGHRRRPDAEPGEHAVDIERRGAVTARLRYDPARTDAGVVEAVAADRGRRDRQPGAAGRAGPPGRAGDRVPRPARDGAPRRAPADGARPARRGPAAAARPRAPAPVGAGQRRRRRWYATRSTGPSASSGSTVQDLRVARQRAPAGRARRRRAAGRDRGAGRPGPAARCGSTSTTPATRRRWRARPGSWSPKAWPTRSSTPTGAR